MCFILFYATQIINPLLNSRISANHDEFDDYEANDIRDDG